MKNWIAFLLAVSCLAPAVAWSQPVESVREIPDSASLVLAVIKANRAGIAVPLTSSFLDHEAVETGARNVDPTTERVVGYAALAAGVIAITILVIGFYKLVKLLGG